MNETRMTVGKVKLIWDTFPCLPHYGLISGDCSIIYNRLRAFSLLFYSCSCLLKLQIVDFPIFSIKKKMLKIITNFRSFPLGSPSFHSPAPGGCVFFFFLCQHKTCKNTNTPLRKFLIGKAWDYQVPVLFPHLS